MTVPSLVGYTTSKKPIYQHDNDDQGGFAELVADFTNDDYFDAMTDFSYLQVPYYSKYGTDSWEYESATMMLKLHTNTISIDFRKYHEANLGLVTAFDISNYGRKHCVPYLQELIAT